MLKYVIQGAALIESAIAVTVMTFGNLDVNKEQGGYIHPPILPPFHPAAESSMNKGTGEKLPVDPVAQLEVDEPIAPGGGGSSTWLRLAKGSPNGVVHRCRV